MGNSEKKILIITLVLLFVSIVLIALISNSIKQKDKEKANEIFSKSAITTYVVSEPKYSCDCLKNSIYGGYYIKDTSEERFSHFGKKEQEKDIFGSYITKYLVSVLNKGKTGNYFVVTFNFKDQRGFEYSESITQYLRAGERKEFVYKDIQFEKTEILSWSYNIERL
jgi:hypothetical protein